MAFNELLQIIFRGKDELSSTVNEQKGLLGSFKGSWTELLSAVDLVEKGFGYLKEGIKAVIDPTMEYGKQVRDLSRLIGATPEEASKLIQVADDVLISYDTLTRSLEYGIRNGIEPSTEAMGELADEYLDIQDPIERSKWLMEKFGRAGADLGPLMELGSKGIKELGQEAEDLGLVLDRETIQKTREYEIALDNLDDSVTALKINIGVGLIPKLSDLANLGAELSQINSFQEGADAAARFINSFVMGKEETVEYHAAMLRAVDGTEELTESTEDLTKETDALREAEDLVESQMQDLATFMAGDLGRENEEYEQSQIDITERIKELQGELITLQGEEANTTEERDKSREKIVEIQGEIDELSEDFKKNADEHEEATKRILFDLLQQQLAVDGLTTDEASALAMVAEKWGLIDQDTYTAWIRMEDYIASLDGARINAIDLWEAVNNIPTEKTVTISVVTQDLSGGEGNLAFQHGGDFIVPPGFMNDSFPIWVSSGERVRVTPAGQQAARGGGQPVIFNLTYAPFISTMDRFEAETRLRPIIEKVVRHG